jgi:hypothetical protein
MRYEDHVVDTNYRRFTRRFSRLAGLLFDHFLAGAAVSRSAYSQATRRAMQPFEERVAVGEMAYAVASRADNRASAELRFATEAEARDHLSRQAAADPQAAQALHVIPAYELAA